MLAPPVADADPVDVLPPDGSSATGVPVQIDSKTRFRVQVPATAQQDEIAAVVTAHPEYARWTQDAAVARLVIVPGRIANVVTRARDAPP